MTELLPCPFCGSDAHIQKDDDRFYVACNGLDCYCAVGEGYDGCAMPKHIFYEEEAAADAWNRRAAIPASAQDAPQPIAWRWKVSPMQLNWQYSDAPPATFPVYNLELLYTDPPRVSEDCRRCQKCGMPTKGEEAYVNGEYWCHPCADACPLTEGMCWSGLQDQVFKTAELLEAPDVSLDWDYRQFLAKQLRKALEDIR